MDTLELSDVCDFIANEMAKDLTSKELDVLVRKWSYVYGTNRSDELEFDLKSATSSRVFNALCVIQARKAIKL